MIMSSYIVTVSPKGQITIPVPERKKCNYKKYLLEVKGKVIVLKPIEIKVLGKDVDEDELNDFSKLAESSFDFWNDPSDDIYEKFYSK